MSLLLVLTGCATRIPNVAVMREIPFADGPEAVYVETVSGKTGLIGPKEYAEMRPYMLMITVEGWMKIKLFIMEQCRKAGANCDTQLNSVSDTIKKVDTLVEKYFGGKF